MGQVRRSGSPRDAYAAVRVLLGEPMRAARGGIDAQDATRSI